MSFTVNNKFEIGDTVFVRRDFDNSVVSGKVASYEVTVSGVQVTKSQEVRNMDILYCIERTKGKNVRSEGYMESLVFATASDAFASFGG